MNTTKKVREITNGLPDGYKVEVSAKYGFDYWHGEEVVRLYVTLTHLGDLIGEEFQMVRKPRRIEIFGKRLTETWEERCQRYMNNEIAELIARAETLEYYKAKTEGLFGSLRD